MELFIFRIDSFSYRDATSSVDSDDEYGYQASLSEYANSDETVTISSENQSLLSFLSKHSKLKPLADAINSTTSKQGREAHETLSGSTIVDMQDCLQELTAEKNIDDIFKENNIESFIPAYEFGSYLQELIKTASENDKLVILQK